MSCVFRGGASVNMRGEANRMARGWELRGLKSARSGTGIGDVVRAITFDRENEAALLSPSRLGQLC